MVFALFFSRNFWNNLNVNMTKKTFKIVVSNGQHVLD